ncbi:MAG: FG-GAP-like repeat-containing protein [Bacteroidota bacterium]|nr:FG-GAP-like repeat-containing protein [Bacteroidota bacterium]
MKLCLKIYLILSLCLIAGHCTLIAQNINKDKELTWVRVDSPVKIDFSSVNLFSSGNGIISGNYLLDIQDDHLKIFNPQPPSLSIDISFALNKKEIWAAKTLMSSESNFYFFDGKKWTIITNPLSNAIFCMYFKDKNTGWIGGDRELAFYNGKKWKKIPFPTINGSVNKLYGTSENDFWMQTGYTELFHYLNGQCYQVLKGVQLFEISKNGIKYALTDKGFYKIIDGTPKFIMTFPSSVKLSCLYILNDSCYWGAGPGGYVYRFANSRWSSFKLSTEQSLVDINFLTDSEGWVCGENGTVFRLAFPSAIETTKISGGFKKKKITGISTELNSEYGVAIDDINNDGLKDIYSACLFHPSRYYENISVVDQNKINYVQFAEKAAERNITAFSNKETNKANPIFLGVGLADLENSGSQDIYVCNLLGKNKLLINDGKGSFDDVSAEKNRGVGNDERTNSVIFGDVDNDGDLDMFIANEESTNRLFLNDGTGHFSEITETAGLESQGGGTSAAFGDLDGDGRIDLCVTNWNAENKIYKNVTQNGKVKFIDVSNLSTIADSKNDKNNAVVFGDVNNDGLLDIFISRRKSPNSLYINLGNFRFKDCANEMLGRDTLLTYGAVFADFDNDGFLDLYISNVGTNKLYKNIGGKKFIDVTNEYNAAVSGYGTGSAVGDIDNDGDIDIYTAVYINGESTLLLNNINNRNFFTINVQGTISNRDAVGVKVWLYEAGHLYDKNYLRGYREICSGSGYCSHSSKEVHFGADFSKSFDILILFPVSGITKILYNQKPGQRLFVREEEDYAAFSTLSLKSIMRFIKNPATHIAAIEYAVFFIICLISVRVGKKKYSWDNYTLLIIHSACLIAFTGFLIYFDKSGFFLSIVFPVLLIGILFILVHLIYHSIILKRIAKKEREIIRDRIARDLHDDLASTLSSAQIYTELLKYNKKSSEHFDLVNKIAVLLKDSSDAITDIIWNIAPVHDNMEHLTFKLRTLAIENCRVNSIKLEVKEEVDNNEFIVPDQIRRNIYLIFKEILNNMIKHSATETAELDLVVEAGSVFIKLKDFGQGILNLSGTFTDYNTIKCAFGHENKSFGHGLKNIFTRAEEIKGSLTITSKPKEGSSFSFFVKIT